MHKLIFLFFSISIFVSGLSGANQEKDKLKPDLTLKSYEATKRKKTPLLAITEIVGLNLGVMSYNRYIAKEEFAEISWGSIKENFKHGFVWDEDHFETNFFMHPYHGSLYFNIARSNGMSFWESVPYAAGGSLMWEMTMENTYPSYNDFIMTTTGGIMLGEALYRLSSQILDNSATGFERVWRELLAGLINPARGFNRLINGKAFKRSGSNSYDRVPIEGYISFGGRGNFSSNIDSKTGKKVDGGAKTMIEAMIVYGDMFKEGKRSPFDTFLARAWISHSKFKPEFSFYAYGLITGKTYIKEKSKQLIGIFQHFDFFNIEIIEIGASSIGIGYINEVQLSERLRLDASLQVGFILVGASNNEYVEFLERDYNFGTGLNIKVDAAFTFESVMTIYLSGIHYGMLSIDGVKGSESLTLLTAKYSFNLSKKVSVGIDIYSYLRESEYKDFPDINQHIHGARAFIAFSF